MLIHDLSPIECVAVLKQTHLGRLACARHDQPYIVPIHFSFDEERNCCYAFSAIGQKVNWMRDNPKVCLEVEEIADKDHWTTVLVFGVYEEIHQAVDQEETRSRAERLFQTRQEWWFPAAGKLPERERPAVVVFRVRIDQVTGRRASRDRL